MIDVMEGEGDMERTGNGKKLGSSSSREEHIKRRGKSDYKEDGILPSEM